MARFYESVLGIWQITAVAGFVLLPPGSSVAGYRQWNFMRHDNSSCTTCHQDVERQPPTRNRSAAGPRSGRLAPNAVVTLASAGHFDFTALLQDTARVQPRFPRFSHGDHRRESCASCHSSRLRHGALRVRSAADCQRCHHTGPGRDQCVTCHSATDLLQPVDRLTRTFRLSVSGRDVTRHIPFPHARHTAVPSCTVCHSNADARAPNTGMCGLCHCAHHQPDRDCATCHGAANPREVHTAAAHPNCANAQCHGNRAPDIAASRTACLLCHADRERHIPGIVCSQCHRVTNPPETRP